MLEVALVGAAAAGISLIISVFCYNMRRSRCIRCKGCGCEIDRENMTDEEMKNDELKMPVAL
jgi:hypothetical protein